MSPALDACPGVLVLHPARDGFVARIRLPGGYASGPRWLALADLSRDFGDGCVDVTARGNVQLRGLRAADAEALAARAAAAGLMPSAQHDRARNIMASPLSGLLGRPPLRALVDALDAALLAGPEFAALPGRFLFALDDGTGGASLASCDLGLSYVAAVPAAASPAPPPSGVPAESAPAQEGFDLIVAGRRVGVRLRAAEAVAAVLVAARAALAAGVGASVTRIAALLDEGQSVAAAVGGALGVQASPDTRLPLGPPSEAASPIADAAPPASATTADADPAQPAPAKADAAGAAAGAAPAAPAAGPQASPASHTGPSRTSRPARVSRSASGGVGLHDRDRLTAGFSGESVTIMEEAHGAGAGGGGGVVVVVVAARLGRLSGEQIRVITGLLAPGEVVRVGVAGRLVIPLGISPGAGAGLSASGGVGFHDRDRLTEGFSGESVTIMEETHGGGTARPQWLGEAAGRLSVGGAAGLSAGGAAALSAGAALARLAAAGLLVTAEDPMGDVTACSGAACHRSLADVRAAAGPVSNYRKTHWAGCSRRCGCPPDAEPVVALDATRYRMPGEGGA